MNKPRQPLSRFLFSHAIAGNVQLGRLGAAGPRSSVERPQAVRRVAPR